MDDSIFNTISISGRKFLDSVLDFSAGIGARVVNSQAAEYFGFEETAGQQGDPIVRPSAPVAASRSAGFSTNEILLAGAAGVAIIFLIKK